MTKHKRISELINGSGYDKLLAVSEKTRKSSRRIPKNPPPIGHHLAVNIFSGGEFLDTLFVDNVDICRSHTVIFYDKNIIEVYVAPLESMLINTTSALFFYKNNTYLEVVRIS
jgi:hypothetical protein